MRSVCFLSLSESINVSFKYVIYLRMFYAGFALKNVLASLVPSFFMVNGILKKIGFLNPKKSKNGFCVSLLDRSIKDLSGHSATKEPQNSLIEVDSSVPLTRHDPKDLRLICSVMKPKVHFRILSGLKI